MNAIHEALNLLRIAPKNLESSLGNLMSVYAGQRLKLKPEETQEARELLSRIDLFTSKLYVQVGEFEEYNKKNKIV